MYFHPTDFDVLHFSELSLILSFLLFSSLRLYFSLLPSGSHLSHVIFYFSFSFSLPSGFSSPIHFLFHLFLLNCLYSNPFFPPAPSTAFTLSSSTTTLLLTLTPLPHVIAFNTLAIYHPALRHRYLTSTSIITPSPLPLSASPPFYLPPLPRLYFPSFFGWVLWRGMFAFEESLSASLLAFPPFVSPNPRTMVQMVLILGRPRSFSHELGKE